MDLYILSWNLYLFYSIFYFTFICMAVSCFKKKKEGSTSTPQFWVVPCFELTSASTGWQTDITIAVVKERSSFPGYNAPKFMFASTIFWILLLKKMFYSQRAILESWTLVTMEHGWGLLWSLNYLKAWTTLMLDYANWLGCCDACKSWR